MPGRQAGQIDQARRSRVPALDGPRNDLGIMVFLRVQLGLIRHAGLFGVRELIAVLVLELVLIEWDFLVSGQLRKLVTHK